MRYPKVAHSGAHAQPIGCAWVEWLLGSRQASSTRCSFRKEFLEVISFGESAVADEGAGDAGEGQEVFGFAFVA
ncbi:hypothetical protein, partial [Streptomyces griseochromogenes]|uniref:hypothetical protein n=1 Tax=Streptomyces griseochromogenes TaxID=68214 RepID=UPI00379609C7